MAGESRFRLWRSQKSQAEPVQVATEQNAAGEVAAAILHEFNTQLGASYLNMISGYSKGSAPYSTQEILNMAKDPMNHISEL